MTDQLFKDEQTPTPQATPEPTPAPIVNPSDLFADQLAVIKNEDGTQKYDTPEKALEALQHSQQYIPELKSKVDTQEQTINELTAKLEAAKKVEDIINQQTLEQGNEPTSPQLGQEDVLKMVTEALTQRSADEAQTANQTQVNTALTLKYGDNAQAEIIKKAAELNMKPSELGALSKSNPSMVLSLFGEKAGNISTTTNSYNLSTEPKVEPLSAPDKSMLRGATSKDQMEFMKKIQSEVYQKHGINQ